MPNVNASAPFCEFFLADRGRPFSARRIKREKMGDIN
jgi:hypothetical protein